MRGSKVCAVNTDETEWLSTQEAARRLGITPRTLYRFIDHGELPAYRFGRGIRLRAHEVGDFIGRSRTQRAGPVTPNPGRPHAVATTTSEPRNPTPPPTRQGGSVCSRRPRAVRD